ncbi:MAG TPA: hypothetical protein VF424_16785, partial [Vicinamibacterales bacterium]
MRTFRPADRTALERWLTRSRQPDGRVSRTARRIVIDVRRRGDVAVREWTQRLDGLTGGVDVSPRELRRGWDATPPA